MVPPGVGVPAVIVSEADAAGGGELEQAEIAAKASTAMTPQPMTLNIAPSPVPAMIVRSFMEPPHAPQMRR